MGGGTLARGRHGYGTIFVGLVKRIAWVTLGAAAGAALAHSVLLPRTEMLALVLPPGVNPPLRQRMNGLTG